MEGVLCSSSEDMLVYRQNPQGSPKATGIIRHKFRNDLFKKAKDQTRNRGLEGRVDLKENR